MPVDDPHVTSTKTPGTALWLPPLSLKEQQRIDRAHRRQRRFELGVSGGFKGKTVWDYLNLLAVLAIPVLIAAGTLWYTSQQTRATAIAAEDQQEETALQNYFDRMSDLLFTEHLATSQPGDEVRQVARARTVTLLPHLNEVRKDEVLQFLYQAKLIGYFQTNKEISATIVDLTDADLTEVVDEGNLRGANLSNTLLSFAFLSGANLSNADLSNAFLAEANLSNVDLSGANLTDAYLFGANLSGANLNGAIVTTQQLNAAASLAGAILPDGSRHP